MQILLLFLLVGQSVAAASDDREYVYQTAGEVYHYNVAQTGENYTFRFDRSPGDKSVKLAAGYQVLRQIYQDDSINKRYSQHYIRERARCYVFDSRFHTYTLCFLPNDFNRGESERFWGFITQIPNWKWLASRILIPVVSAFALFFYTTKRRPV